MSELWYWKHGRDLLGPLETQTLEDLIRRRRIADRDQVRLTTDEHWLSGAQVKALFAGRDPDAETSQAAAKLLAEAGKRRMSLDADAEVAAQAGLPDRIWFQVRRVLRLMLAPVDGLTERVAELLVFCLKLLSPLANRYVVLASVLVVLAAVLVARVRTGTDSLNRRAYADASQAWADLQGLQSRDASQEEFEAFSAATLPILDRHLMILMEDARHSAGPAADALLTTGTSLQGWEAVHLRKALIQAMLALKKLLALSPESRMNSPTANIVRQNLTLAGSLFEEGLKMPVSTYMARPAENERRDEGVSPLVVGFLVIDGVLLCGGLWFWLRRRSLAN